MRYAEVIVAQRFHTVLGLSEEQVWQAVVRGCDRAMAHYPIDTRLFLGLARHQPPEQVPYRGIYTVARPSNLVTSPVSRPSPQGAPGALPYRPRRVRPVGQRESAVCISYPRSQPHQSQTACPMMSALSSSDSHDSSSVNIVTHCRQEHGIFVISVPQNSRCGPKAS